MSLNIINASLITETNERRDISRGKGKSKTKEQFDTYGLGKSTVPYDSGQSVVVLTTMDNDDYRQ